MVSEARNPLDGFEGFKKRRVFKTPRHGTLLMASRVLKKRGFLKLRGTEPS